MSVKRTGAAAGLVGLVALACACDELASTQPASCWQEAPDNPLIASDQTIENAFWNAPSVLVEEDGTYPMGIGYAAQGACPG